MRLGITTHMRMALLLAAALTTTTGAASTFAADGALLAIEDEWRRVATLTVQDEGRSQGITLPSGTAFALMADGGGTLGSAPASSGSHVLYLSRPAHRLKAGLYEAVVDTTGRTRLFHFDAQLGRVIADLRVPPGDPAAFHTPLGDDMCRKAPALIMSFCQTFVACAAYGFFC